MNNENNIDKNMMLSAAIQFSLIAKIMCKHRKLDETTTFMPLLPVMVNSALSSEIYLKLILHMEAKKIPQEHRLSKLFGEISKESRKSIIEFLEKDYLHNKNEIPRNIEVFSNDFVKFRYIYEQTKKNNFLNLGSIKFSIDFSDSCARQVKLLDPSIEINTRLPEEFSWVQQPISP